MAHRPSPEPCPAQANGEPWICAGCESDIEPGSPIARSVYGQIMCLTCVQPAPACPAGVDATVWRETFAWAATRRPGERNDDLYALRLKILTDCARRASNTAPNDTEGPQAA